MAATKRLLDLTAEELMSRDVLTIPRGMSVRAAAHRLVQAGVSGAPVTDETGRCVGVLTQRDLARFIDQGAVQASEETPGCWSDWQVVDAEGLPADEVSRYMSSEVVAAAPDTRLGELARRMHEGHVHRLLVLDSWGRAVGIVSSMDVLGAVAAEDAISPA